MLNSGIKSAKKWLTGLLALILSILVCLGIAAYLIDPYFAYRFRDDTYIISSQFAMPGIIKNADYDSAVIGSSMIQNFNMNSFRENLDCMPIKLSNGGISLTEMSKLYTLLKNEGKSQRYYFCLDLYLFSYHENEDNDRTPDYLTDDNYLNDYRYLLGYATWMRFIPVDLAYVAMDKLDISLPEKFSQSKKLDYLEDWSLDAVIGQEAVIDDYLTGTHNVSSVDLNNLYDRMIQRADTFMQSIDLSDGDYTFFFPPYSALFWYTAESEGYFDTYLAVKSYMIEVLAEKENVKVYDFQNEEWIADLNNYCDMSHYGPDINEWMIDCFADGYCLIQASGSDERNSQLEQIVDNFTSANSDWLK